MYPLLRDEAQDSFRVWQASDLEIDY